MVQVLDTCPASLSASGENSLLETCPASFMAVLIPFCPLKLFGALCLKGYFIEGLAPILKRSFLLSLLFLVVNKALCNYPCNTSSEI